MFRKNVFLENDFGVKNFLIDFQLLEFNFHTEEVRQRKRIPMEYVSMVADAISGR